MSGKVVLYYFNGRGRMESVRWLLAAAGVEVSGWLRAFIGAYHVIVTSFNLISTFHSYFHSLTKWFWRAATSTKNSWPVHLDAGNLTFCLFCFVYVFYLFNGLRIGLRVFDVWWSTLVTFVPYPHPWDNESTSHPQDCSSCSFVQKPTWHLRLQCYLPLYFRRLCLSFGKPMWEPISDSVFLHVFRVVSW